MVRNVATGFSFVLVSRVLVLIIGIAISPILVRWLGAEPYGSYVFLFSLFSLYMTVISSGVTDGVRKYVSENRDTPQWEAKVVAFFVRYAVLFAALGAAVLYGIARTGVIEPFVGGDRLGWYLTLLAILVVAAQAREFARRTLMGFKLEQYSESLRVLYKIGFLAIALTLIAFGYGVEGVIASHIATSSILAVVGFAVIARRVSLWEVVTASTRDLPRREMLSFNSLSIVLILFITSLYHIDVILLRVFVGELQVAYYKVALLFAQFLWFVPAALQTVLLQSTSDLFERDAYAQIKALAARITRYTVLLTVIMGMGIAVLAPTVLPIMYSPAFLASVTPLLILIPGAFGFAVARPIMSIGQGSGELRDLVIATGAAAGLNLVLNVALIPRYGMTGAAIATTVSYGSMCVFHVWSARRIGFDPLADLRPVPTLGAALVTAPVLFALAAWAPGRFLELVVVPPVGLAVFTLTAFSTGALTPAEVTEFLDSIPGPFGSAARTVTHSVSGMSRQRFQRWLFGVGSLLFVAGILVTMGTAGMGPVLGGGDDPDRTPTPDPTTDAPTTTVPTDTTTPPTQTTTRTPDPPPSPTTTTTATTTPPDTTTTTTQNTTTRNTTTTTTRNTTTTTRNTTTTTTTTTTTRNTTTTTTTTTTRNTTTTTTQNTTTTTSDGDDGGGGLFGWFPF